MSITPRFVARERSRKPGVQVPAGEFPTLEAIVDVGNLLRTFDYQSKHGGPAPGPDGIRYQDVCRLEMAQIFKVVRDVVLQGGYRPHSSRMVRIPKASGKGKRTLAIHNLVDRVLAAALHLALQPCWEQHFMSGSYGYRTNLGMWDMLAQMEAVARHHDRWILVTDDIRDAFGSVRIDEAMADHRRYLSEPKLLGFIEAVLRGNPVKEVGIEQGSAYSPDALNLRLHWVHDIWLNEDMKQPTWFRYVDNLAYLCQDVSEGTQLQEQSQSQLQGAGLRLKGEDGSPVDLREGEAQLLGFQISATDGRLILNLTQNAWSELGKDLRESHEASHPPTRAQQVANGWVAHRGPALENWQADAMEGVLEVAAQQGFRELSRTQLNSQWQSSKDRWRNLRETAYDSPPYRKAI